MYLIEAVLENFRSYRGLRFKCEQGIVLFHGPNGSGKTNLLEAIYFAATSRGFRSGRDADLVLWGASSCSVKTTIRRKDGIRSIGMSYTPGSKKEASVDGATVDRVAEAIGCLHVVDFGSRDLSIVRGEPARRREFMDVELAQLRSDYGLHLARYKRALAQRNALLNEVSRRCSAVELASWDEQLVRYGEPIIEAREAWMSRIASQAREAYGELAGGQETLECRYVPDVEPGQLSEALRGSRGMDIARGTTSRGPHRDDIEVLVGGTSARRFASQGQQRTAALALKWAEAIVAANTIGEDPVLLLDDVLSDLDETRRNRLLAVCTRFEQIIVTCTEVHHLETSLLRRARIVRIHKSTLQEDGSYAEGG